MYGLRLDCALDTGDPVSGVSDLHAARVLSIENWFGWSITWFQTATSIASHLVIRKLHLNRTLIIADAFLSPSFVRPPSMYMLRGRYSALRPSNRLRVG